MAELIVFESSLQIVKKYLACMNLLTQKLLTRASIWIRLLVSWQLSKLAVDFCVKLICDKIFSLEQGTFCFKLELLLAILPHSDKKFNIFFSLTKQNWIFESFQLTVYEILRGGNFKLSTAASAKTDKNKKNWGKFPNFKHFILSHIRSF